MTFRLLDVTAVARLARDHGAVSVIDNTWATPLFQKPCDLGIDLVVHTASKYLGGHSDLMAGVVAGSQERLDRLFYDAYLLLGAALGPMDAWLVNRGLRTLPARMRQHHVAVARFLADHPRVRRVFHPLVAEAASLVDGQLAGFSGLFSFELDTDRYDEVAAVVDRLRLFRIGVSWGGVESLVLSPNRGDNAAALERQGIPPGTVRLSVGLESPDALISDLAQALGAA